MIPTEFRRYALAVSKALSRRPRPPQLVMQVSRFVAHLSLMPLPSQVSPSQVLERLLEVPLPEGMELDNPETVASVVKSFHFSSRRIIAISLYLMDPATAQVHVLEFTYFPATGIASLELFPN